MPTSQSSTPPPPPHPPPRHSPRHLQSSRSIRRRSSAPGRPSLENYEARCGGTTLPFPSDEILHISEVDSYLNIYNLLFQKDACARALQVLANEAGRPAGDVLKVDLHVTLDFMDDVDEVKPRTGRCCLSLIRERVRHMETCIVLVSVFGDVWTHDTVLKEHHAVVWCSEHL